MLQTYQQFQMYTTFNRYSFSKRNNFCKNVVLTCAVILCVTGFKQKASIILLQSQRCSCKFGFT